VQWTEFMLQLIASMVLLCGEILYLLQDFKRGVLAGILVLGLTADVLPWHFLPISGVATIAFLVFCAFAIIYVIRPQYSKHKNIEAIVLSRGYLVLLFCFVAIALLYVLAAGENAQYGLDKTILVILRGVIPVFVFRLLIQESRDFKTVYYTFIAISVLGTAFLLSADVTQAYTVSLDQVNTIVAARIVGIGAVLLGTFLLFTDKISWIHYTVFTPLFFVLIIGTLLTGSRGPLTGILVVLSLVILLSGQFQLWGRSTFLFAGIFFATLLLTFFADWSLIDTLSVLGQNRIVSTILTLNFERIDSGRFELYEIAIDAITKSTAIGIGTGGFGNVMGGYIGRIYPHNIFLEVTLEQGLIGLSILLIIVATTFYRCVRLLRDRDANIYLKCVPSVWIYTLYNAQFSGDIGANYQFWAVGGLVWIAHALALATSRMVQEQESVIINGQLLQCSTNKHPDAIKLVRF